MTRAEYLSGLSKNDLEGRGQSIFSDSGCALTSRGHEAPVVSAHCSAAGSQHKLLFFFCKDTLETNIFTFVLSIMGDTLIGIVLSQSFGKLSCKS